MHTRDRVEVLVETAIAREVAERRNREAEVERKNLAIEVGNVVGNVVGRQIGEALQNIARAMRPR